MSSAREALADVRARGETFFKLLESPVPTPQLHQAREELRTAISTLKRNLDATGVNGLTYLQEENKTQTDFESVVRKKEKERVEINNSANAILRVHLRDSNPN
mmetsp:Transcript_12056/g.13865  ORF Transcript_12056/g.13865 Transcript_12056/m.13865 type:complete len:103 (-) Transcript_12056:1692-2000(-)